MAEDKNSNNELPVTTTWIVTEGLTGLQNQAIGLAEALGLSYILKEIKKPKKIWRLVLPDTFSAVPPWPDLLISCGRLSVAVSIAVRKASAGRTFTVHIQDPHIDARQFDAVIVPSHDGLRGDNVLVTKGAIHRVTAEKLLRAASRFSPALKWLPRPLICVLVGGKSRHQNFSVGSAHDFADKLCAAAANSGGGLAITPSRRTGAAIEEILRLRLRKIYNYIWDGTGENPYFGMLALADAVVVTSDSISMISEACFTGKPVYVYQLPDGSNRLRKFIGNLMNEGIVRPFTGKIESWKYQPFDETQRAADFVRKIFLSKMELKQNELLRA